MACYTSYMNDKPLLRDIIYTTDLWRRIDGGYAPYTRTAGPTAEYTALYFESDFYEIDPRLPVVLAEMNNQFGGRWLRIPLEYWSNPEVYLPGQEMRDGSTCPDYPVRYLRDFTTSIATGLITVTFTAYEMRRSATGLIYPTGHIPRTVAYPQWVVDERIPHWAERFALGAALELTDADLTSYIIGAGYPSQAANTNGISELTFD